MSVTHSYQPFNRLTGTSSATYAYDNNGNMLSMTDASGTSVLSWNTEGQLNEVNLPGGLIVNYKYDALGRRIQRTTSGDADERYVYDGYDVLVDLNSNSSVVTTYLNNLGIDYHLRQTSVGGAAYFLTDHLGSTAALANADGELLQELSYDSFGNQVGSSSTRYTYTGRERDSDTGLLYYRARWYNPDVGLFLSQDPIGFKGGDINLYVYVHNKATMLTDPSGEQGRVEARWMPGEIEASRELADHVRTLRSCRSGKPSVYLCCRDIDVNFAVDFLAQVTGYKHCFIKTDSKEAGMGNVGGGPLPSYPYGIPTSINNHSGQSSKATCTPVCDVDAMCMDKELEIGRPTGNWAFSNNCNTFASDIITRCKRQAAPPSAPTPPSTRLTAWDKR